MKLPPPAATLALCLLLGAGCDALHVSPGGDFGVTVLDAAPIRVMGRITIPLHFRVTGCDAFEAAVSGAAGRHTVEARGMGGEAFVAEVPVEWLRGDDGNCLHDAASPQEATAQIVVTCLDAGRSVAADLAVRYGTATRAGWMRAWNGDRLTIEQISAHVDPLRPLALAPWWFSDRVGIYPWTDSATGSFDARPPSDNPLVEPRVAASPGRFFVSMGCPPLRTCYDVPVSANLKVPGVRLNGQGLRPEDGYVASFEVGSAWVPAQVVDMAFSPDGALVVLSQLDARTAGASLAAVVTRVEPVPVNFHHDVRVIGYFPGEHVLTRFSRDLAGGLHFLTGVAGEPWGTRYALRTTDGLVVNTLLDPTVDRTSGAPLPGSIHPSIDLAPDASALVVDGVVVGPPGGPFLPLSLTAGWSRDVWSGTTWASDAIATWTGQSLRSGSSPSSDVGWVQAFDRTPPHARRFGYEVHALAGVSSAVALHGVTAVGDKLVLTTSTGIRVLGRTGRVIGGSDPLPCRLAPTAIAAQTGPSHVAVGADQYLYVFDLSELDDTFPATPGPAAVAAPGAPVP